MRWEGGLRHRRDARESLAIMAVRAIVDDADMTHGRIRKRREIARRMTRFAARAGGKVISWFRHRRHTGKALAAMATRTIIDDSGVTHYAGNKRRRIVTYRTSQRCRKVVGGQRANTDVSCKTHRRTVAARTVSRGWWMC